MIYAEEILDAVKRGGLSNWATTTGRNSKQSMFTNRKAEKELCYEWYTEYTKVRGERNRLAAKSNSA